MTGATLDHIRSVIQQLEKTWNHTPRAAALGFVTVVGLASLGGTTLGHAASLDLLTTDETRNLNPLSYDSYPALRAIRLTTESLFERRCIGGGDEEEAQTFVPYCARGDSLMQPDGWMRMQIASKRCSLGGREISPRDIEFTLREIEQVIHNDYQFYRYQSTPHPFRLTIENPKNPPEWILKNALTFPIIRRGNGVEPGFYEHSIKPENSAHRELFNRANAGRYKLEAFGEKKIVLGRRSTSSGNVERVEVSSYVLFRQILEILASPETAGSARVVLSYPYHHPFSEERYIARFVAENNGFTYAGFNFRVRSEFKRELFRDQGFRELFTKSLWSVGAITNGLGIGPRPKVPRGIFIGQSFDPRYPSAANILPKDEVERRVKAFLENRQVDRLYHFNVLLSPHAMSIFDETERANLREELTRIWHKNAAAGFSFKIIDAASGNASFRDMRLGGNFDIIIERLSYGRSPFKYMAFVMREHESNYLGIDIEGFGDQAVEQLMSQGTLGVKRFLDRVNGAYPVAVLGVYPTRDLISANIVRGGSACPLGSIPDAYFGITEWRVP